ncbi:MAG: sxtJ [Gammaproteobacteria bacterium]|nr:sxtJ [Gammaproteobacteria bacterium]NNL50315.1 sxtJ [Woeseiaceae bacterium]
MTIDIEEELSAAELRNFGLSTGAIVAVLFGVIIPWIWDFGYPVWPWIVLAILGGLGLIAPMSLRLVHRYWMRFALLISKVTTPIILGIVFFLVFMPVGLVIRVFSRDPLARQFDPDAETYRIVHDRQSAGTLEKPY